MDLIGFLKKIFGLWSESSYAPYEQQIMKKYKKLSLIEPEDKDVLAEYASIGFVNHGPCRTAELTDLGKSAL